VNKTGSYGAGRGHSQDDDTREYPLPHYLSCSRCGYYRRLDTRTMLSRQTTCPWCPAERRLELSAERPLRPLRIGSS
jgi:hypothetical protein